MQVDFDAKQFKELQKAFEELGGYVLTYEDGENPYCVVQTSPKRRLVWRSRQFHTLWAVRAAISYEREAQNGRA